MTGFPVSGALTRGREEGEHPSPENPSCRPVPKPPTSTPWDILADRLHDTGHLANGALRRARPIPCPRCGAHTLFGLDSDRVAMAVRVDPTPLTPLGEALAILASRPTFSLDSEGGRLVLNYRHDYRITHRPAGTGHFDVLPLHHCHSPAQLPTTTTAHATTVHHLPIDPPF